MDKKQAIIKSFENYNLKNLMTLSEYESLLILTENNFKTICSLKNKKECSKNVGKNF